VDVDMDADAVLAEHARAHHGVFRGEHARLAGLSDRQIEERIRGRRWERLHRDVYRISGAPPTWVGDLLAACWAGGFRAVASHRSAARLHGLPGGTTQVVEISCPRWRRTRQPSLVVHETKLLAPRDITIIDGVPSTTAERTVFDMCGAVRLGMAELVFESALRRGLVSTSQMWRALDRLSRSGRPGGTNLRTLLQARDPRQAHTDSEMEVRVLQLLRAAGLPDPVVQYEVWDGSRFVARVDMAYPDAGVAIEYDSDEFHSGRLATRRDRDRRHRLIAAGWLPIDVGPEQLRRGGQQLCTAVSEALRARTREAS
jgi:hypothetical protein